MEGKENAGYEAEAIEKPGKEGATDRGMDGNDTDGVEMEKDEPGGIPGILDGEGPGTILPDWPHVAEVWTKYDFSGSSGEIFASLGSRMSMPTWVIFGSW